MNVLEKILEEISEVEKEYVTGHKVLYALGATGMATEISSIIRSHMDDVPKCGECNRRKFYMQGYEDGKKNDGWIPVEEKLPEEDKRYKGRKVIDVLVTTAKGKATKVQRQSHNGYWWWGRIYGEPTAWQPLPEPYKDGRRR